MKNKNQKKLKIKNIDWEQTPPLFDVSGGGGA